MNTARRFGPTSASIRSPTLRAGRWLLSPRDLAEQQDTRLRAAWPCASRFERRASSRIRRAYVQARYGDHYRIQPDELAWAMARVDMPAALVASVCADHLAIHRLPSCALAP